MENSMNFTVEAERAELLPNGKGIVIEFKDAKIYEADEKHVIKTFSDATLIEEISNRYNCVITINQIKE